MITAPSPPDTRQTTTARPRRRPLLPALVVSAVVVLAVASLFIGVSDVSLETLLADSDDGTASRILLISRLPRTLAILLTGAALGVAGLIMQLMARNKFVEPSTVGTVESAMLGILVVTVLAPGAPLLAKMGVAGAFGIAGTALFLLVLRRVPLRNTLIVPLVGIMLGGIIGAVTTFLAYRFDLLQSLNSWMVGDFSGVIAGRYEFLWLVGALAVVGYLAADRFTVAGMGREFTTNLGLNYRAVMSLGLVIVSLVSAVVVVTVGAVPFLGLVVPNLVSMLMGDNVRRSVPWVALLGAGLVLVCDILGRLIRFPYEIPVGTVLSVVGAAIFLYLLLRSRRRVA